MNGDWTMMNRVRRLLAASATGILVASTMMVPAAQAKPPRPSGPLTAQSVPLGDDGKELRGIARKHKDVPDLQLPALALYFPMSSARSWCAVLRSASS
jgi:hypothetical protein